MDQVLGQLASFALRRFGGRFVATAAKVNLHGIPVKPIAVTFYKDQAAMEALEFIFSGLSFRSLHGGCAFRVGDVEGEEKGDPSETDPPTN